MSILLKIMNPRSYEQLMNFFEDTNDLDQNLVKEQKYFIKKISQELMIKRPKEKYGDSLTKKDYDDISKLAAINAMNMPMIESLIDDKYCNNCGKCCTETPLIILLSNEYQELKRSIPHLDKKVHKHPYLPEHYSLNSKPCSFYDIKNKKCTIYNKRPSVCKSYPISYQIIDGIPRKVFVTLSGCEYSVQVILNIAIKTFDKCLN